MGIFDFKDEGLEQLEGLGNTAKQMVKQAPKSLKNTVTSQVKGGTDTSASAGQAAPADQGGAGGYTPEEQQQMLEQMYGATPVQNAQHNPNGPKPVVQSQSIGSMITGSHPQEKSPEEQAKIKNLRDKLHYELYYKAIDEAGKTKQQDPSVQEEKQQEEQEKKQEEMVKKQEEQKTKEDLAVANARKGTGEHMKGVGG